MHTNVIRLGIIGKLDSFDGSSPNNTALATRWIPSITRPSDERMMAKLKSAASIKRTCSTEPRQVSVSSIGPKWLVELSDSGQRDVNARKALAQPHEPIDVPRQQPALRGAEVVLLAHFEAGWTFA
jgi:hypothetical protein